MGKGSLREYMSDIARSNAEGSSSSGGGGSIASFNPENITKVEAHFTLNSLLKVVELTKNETTYVGVGSLGSLGFYIYFGKICIDVQDRYKNVHIKYGNEDMVYYSVSEFGATDVAYLKVNDEFTEWSVSMRQEE